MTSRLSSPARSLSADASRVLAEENFLREGFAGWLERGAILTIPGDDKAWVGWGNLAREPAAHRRSPDGAPDDLPGSFLVPDFFFDDAAPRWSFESYTQVNRKRLREALSKRLAAEAPPLQPLAWTDAVEPDFQSAFRELSARFQAGTLEKAVPVVFDRAAWPESDARLRTRRLSQWILSALMHAFGSPVHVYGAWNSDERGPFEGTLGATPELLIRKLGPSRWTTMALAGTRRDSDRAGLPALLDDPKERREHQLVINGIRAALEPFGKVELGATAELRLPGLAHLRTKVTLETNASTTLSELVRALHPTPAVGASPREAGPELLRLLDQRAPVARRRFGAPFGFSLYDEDAFSALAVVSIRNLQWDEKEIVAGAGCGVIRESQPEREWLELRAKLASIRKIFGA